MMKMWLKEEKDHQIEWDHLSEAATEILDIMDQEQIITINCSIMIMEDLVSTETKWNVANMHQEDTTTEEATMTSE